MQQVLTIEDIKDWLNNYKHNPGTFKAINRSSDEDLIHQNFLCVAQYLSFKDDCINALVKLKSIVHAENFTESAEIKAWLLMYEKLGPKELILFLTDCEPNEQNNVLKILGLDISVELKPFIPLIIFCEVFQILYWELQLHLPFNEREFDKPEYYYYTLPDPVPPEIRIRKFLKKLHKL